MRTENGDGGILNRQPRSSGRIHFREFSREQVGEVPYGGIGADLRAVRESRDLSIENVAENLRLQRDHLVALEEGRVEDLPGVAYAIGFIRSYAQFLDMDSSFVVERFKEEEAVRADPTRLIFPEPIGEARRPSWRLALVSLFVLASAYGAWWYIQERDNLILETVSGVPETMRGLLSDDQMNKKIQPNVVESDGKLISPKRKKELKDSSVGSSFTTGNVQKKVSDKSNLNNVKFNSVVEGVPISDFAKNKLVEPTNANVASSVEDMLRRVEDAPGLNRLTEPVTSAAHSADPSIKKKPFGEGESITPFDGLSSPIEAAGVDRDLIKKDDLGSAKSLSDPGNSMSILALKKKKILSSKPINTTEVSGPNNGRVASINTKTVIPEQRGYKLPSIVPSETSIGPSIPIHEPAAERKPRSYGVQDTSARVVIRAHADSWVQVEGSNKELLLTKMLKAGDVFFVPNRSDLLLMTGNAGAIEFLVDGKTVGRLGPNGQVRRGVNLYADRIIETVRRSRTSLRQ